MQLSVNDKINCKARFTSILTARKRHYAKLIIARVRTKWNCTLIVDSPHRHCPPGVVHPVILPHYDTAALVHTERRESISPSYAYSTTRNRNILSLLIDWAKPNRTVENLRNQCDKQLEPPHRNWLPQREENHFLRHCLRRTLSILEIAGNIF